LTYYDNYITRITAYGDNSRETQINASVAVVNSLFANNPSYTTITIDSVSTGVILLDGKDSTHKFILFLPDTTIIIGEIVTITTTINSITNSAYWLVTDFVSSPISPKASIELCNETLKWQDSIGFKYSIPCIATRSLLTKMEIKETNYAISLLQGEMNVFVPNTPITETIIAQQKFYLGNYVYEVAGIDDISNIGIIRFSMKTSTKAESDNDTLRICNYKGEIDFTITNSNAELLVDDILQVTTQFTLNSNIIIPSYTITYSSDDITKVTVDSSGLITAVDIGSATITATATALNNTTLSDSFTITVSESVVDNYEIEITGDAEIPYGQSKTYTAVVRNNGIIVSGKNVTWSIFSGSSYASITSSTGTTCVLKNITNGTVVLKAQFGIETITSKTKSIICEGMW